MSGTRNYGVYVREARQANGEIRREVFKTHSEKPDPAWGPVTRIHPDVPRLSDGDAMIHALNVVGYQSVGMK